MITNKKKTRRWLTFRLTRFCFQFPCCVNSYFHFWLASSQHSAKRIHFSSAFLSLWVPIVSSTPHAADVRDEPVSELNFVIDDETEAGWSPLEPQNYRITMLLSKKSRGNLSWTEMDIHYAETEGGEQLRIRYKCGAGRIIGPVQLVNSPASKGFPIPFHKWLLLLLLQLRLQFERAKKLRPRKSSRIIVIIIT